MLAGIDAVELPLVDRHIVNVGRAWDEVHLLDNTSSLDVVLEQARRITRVVTGTGFLGPAHLPDEPVVVRDAVQPLDEAAHREHPVDLPGLGIDAHDRPEPIGVYPDLVDVLLPRHAVRRTAIFFRTERNLPMADLL